MTVDLKSYLEKQPEIIVEWCDNLSEARGWLVINSLKGGAAGGGTRMRKGLTKQEVIDLAKTMEIKFAVCGPPIGGAKSGINFDPSDPRKEDVLRRWFAAIKPMLKSYYGTAGDLNIDEKKEVSPMLKQLGIVHPQTGVLEGHFKYGADLKNKILERLQQGSELIIQSEMYSPLPNSNRYTSIDLITGFGVSESVKIFYQLYKKQNIKNKRTYIQGWGNVGAAAGWFLSKEGARILVIEDKEGYIINENGFSFEEITLFINEKTNNTIQDNQKNVGAFPIEILAELNIEVFIPAAASKLVTENFMEMMMDNGLELISCGANVPFDEDENIFGSLSKRVDQRLALIPDFIANCGVARLFAYLMENRGAINENAIFNDVSKTIFKAIKDIYDNNPEPINLSRKSWNIYIN